MARPETAHEWVVDLTTRKDFAEFRQHGDEPLVVTAEGSPETLHVEIGNFRLVSNGAGPTMQTEEFSIDGVEVPQSLRRVTLDWEVGSPPIVKMECVVLKEE